MAIVFADLGRRRPYLDRPVWPFRLNGESPQSQGLVSWTPMTKETGVFDVARHTMGINNSVTTITRAWDRVGPAFDFTTDRYIDHGAVVVPTSGVTLSAWVVYTLSAATHAILSKGYDGTNTQIEMYATVGSSGRVTFGSYNGSSNGVTSTTALTIGVPTLVTGVYDGATYRIYLNGLQDNSNAATGPVATARRLLVGAVDNNGTAANFWNGDIWDARVYGRALPAAEVWALYEPSTRWDLYWVPGRRVFFDVGAVGGGNRRRRVLLAS